MLAPSIVKPAPFAAAESAAPLATKIFLSSTCSVEVFKEVSVPWTVKLPNIVTSAELSVIAVSNDCVNKFNLEVSSDSDINPNAVICSEPLSTPSPSGLSTEPLTTSSPFIFRYEEVALSISPNLVSNEEVVDSISSNLPSKEDVVEFIFVIETSTDELNVENPFTESMFTCADCEITLSPFISKNTLVNWSEPDTTPLGRLVSIWSEPDITPVGKLAIVCEEPLTTPVGSESITCCEPLNTPSPFILRYEEVAVSIWSNLLSNDAVTVSIPSILVSVDDVYEFREFKSEPLMNPKAVICAEPDIFAWPLITVLVANIVPTWRSFHFFVVEPKS